MFVAGAAIQWLRDGLRAGATSEDVARLADGVADSAGVVVVPAFTGLGAPYWDPDARGAIFGITRGTELGHIARATLEAIAHQVADVVEAMEADTGRPLRSLRVDGGAARNDALMQLQADLLGAPIERPMRPGDHRARGGLPGRPGDRILVRDGRHRVELDPRSALRAGRLRPPIATPGAAPGPGRSIVSGVGRRTLRKLMFEIGARQGIA